MGVVVVPKVLEELRRPSPGALEVLAGVVVVVLLLGHLLQLAAQVALAAAEAEAVVQVQPKRRGLAGRQAC